MNRERELLRKCADVFHAYGRHYLLRKEVESFLSQLEANAAEPARKIGGSYQADGWIVARFTTRAGKKRVVFEFNTPSGMLHIFNTEQIKIAPLPEAEPSMNPPFSNCKYKICDLPGQCTYEGKCHHPAPSQHEASMAAVERHKGAVPDTNPHAEFRRGWSYAAEIYSELEVKCDELRAENEELRNRWLATDGCISIPMTRYRELLDCLEAMATGKGNCDWRSVLNEHRQMLECNKGD